MPIITTTAKILARVIICRRSANYLSNLGYDTPKYITEDHGSKV
jgi:hypothetical protein